MCTCDNCLLKRREKEYRTEELRTAQKAEHAACFLLNKTIKELIGLGQKLINKNNENNETTDTTTTVSTKSNNKNTKSNNNTSAVYNSYIINKERFEKESLRKISHSYQTS